MSYGKIISIFFAWNSGAPTLAHPAHPIATPLVGIAELSPYCNRIRIPLHWWRGRRGGDAGCVKSNWRRSIIITVWCAHKSITARHVPSRVATRNTLRTIGTALLIRQKEDSQPSAASDACGGMGWWGRSPPPMRAKNILECKWKWIQRQKSNFYILMFKKTLPPLHRMH